MKGIAERAYHQFLLLSPEKKIMVRPHQLMMAHYIYQHVENKLKIPLFNAVPEQVAKSSLQADQISCVDLLFNTMIDVAPGNRLDREQAYHDAVAKKECRPEHLYEKLHSWKFVRRRLEMLGCTAPDANLQMEALLAMTVKWADTDKHFQVRLSTYLAKNNSYGGIVNLAQVEDFWNYLTAEAREKSRSYSAGVDKTATLKAATVGNVVGSKQSKDLKKEKTISNSEKSTESQKQKFQSSKFGVSKGAFGSNKSPEKGKTKGKV